MRIGWEVTIGVTIHDRMSGLRPKGASGGHLRQQLWARFWKICSEESINGQNWGQRPNLNSKGTTKK